ncbi:hypothetical protein [Amylolactobacillus amylophilus]|uniref:hypothetical protein n=1 Tax=Amylolactobacillus amylophilus TaxID=1603 RepID=UPI0006CFC3AC|nr:hypothetical protein [Amylolactobacillus amylophilus]
MKCYQKNVKGKLSIKFDKLSGNLENIVYQFLKHSKKQASWNTLEESKSESLTIFGNWDSGKTIYENWKQILEEKNYVYGSASGIKDLPIKRGYILPDFLEDGEISSIGTEAALDELTIVYHQLNSNGQVISDYRSFLTRRFESSMGKGEKFLLGVEQLYLVDDLKEVQTYDKNGDTSIIVIDDGMTLKVTKNKLNIAIAPGPVSPARIFLKELSELLSNCKIMKIIIKIHRVLPDKEQGNLMLDFLTQELDLALK